jgi:hypothetical protein
VLVAAVRFLVVVFVVRMGLRLFASARRPRRTEPTDLVRDRVCNTFLPRDRALAVTLAGRTEHFCSPECRDRAQHALDSRGLAVQSHAPNGGAEAR